MQEIRINTKDCIIPMYQSVLDDILDHKHTHYVLAGGRGSTKSSFVGIAIPLLLVAYSDVNAVCFRKIANTIQNSIYSQIVWGIYTLGLQDYFNIPKVYNNPIVFKPTGQKIFFLGVDDPQKIKSIKPKLGYIGVSWFEETDSFAGENELRTILQSTMRGGKRFWDFRTFNPPISANNWANEYADEAEHQADTLVVRNTYKDVPIDWLGEQFILEAEKLKRINPRAYEHEYLGKAVGTGGNVFPNVIDFDATQKTADGFGGKVEMYKTFDNIYNGLDWGYALDPLHFVRCHFDSRRLILYIFDEFRTIKARNEETFEELYKVHKKLSLNELLIADSAEPKSIGDYKAYGANIKPVSKYANSVRDGIKWLQGLNEIRIDKRRCPYTYKEFIRYEYAQDKDGNFYSAYPDKDNHAIDAVRYAMSVYWRRKGN